MTMYLEEFEEGPGGWLKVVDNWHVSAPLPVRDSALWCYGPWWVDYNHAPPGGGYLQLLACLMTRGPIGEVPREVGGRNKFVHDRFPTKFTGARFTVRLKGELEPDGTHACLLIQGVQEGICAGWVLTGQPILVRKEYSETTLTLDPDPSQWTPLGSRHDRKETYGIKPLAQILADVNVNVYLIFFPVHPKPMGPIDGDPHLLRAGHDYPIWPSSVTQGYVAIDKIQIEFQANQ